MSSERQKWQLEAARLDEKLKATMLCAFCGTTKPWPEHFVNRTYAQCLTCWLRHNPKQIEPMRGALAEIDAATRTGGSEQ